MVDDAHETSLSVVESKESLKYLLRHGGAIIYDTYHVKRMTCHNGIWDHLVVSIDRKLITVPPSTLLMSD